MQTVTKSSKSGGIKEAVVPSTGLEATYSQLVGKNPGAARLSHSAIIYKEAGCGLQHSARTKCSIDDAHYQTQPPTSWQKKPQWSMLPTATYL